MTPRPAPRSCRGRAARDRTRRPASAARSTCARGVARNRAVALRLRRRRDSIDRCAERDLDAERRRRPDRRVERHAPDDADRRPADGDIPERSRRIARARSFDGRAPGNAAAATVSARPWRPTRRTLESGLRLGEVRRQSPAHHERRRRASPRAAARFGRIAGSRSTRPISNSRTLPCMRARLYSARRASVSSSSRADTPRPPPADS